MIEWNSTKVIPQYNKHYLVYTESGHMHIIFYWADSWENFIKEKPHGATITHWAELPPPPVDKIHEKENKS